LGKKLDKGADLDRASQTARIALSACGRLARYSGSNSIKPPAARSCASGQLGSRMTPASAKAAASKISELSERSAP
jgi:hypothetical protein